ncbi:CO dehydrogenase maturation factor [Desulfacinum hydrothermale DSM 13146]|uniref:CO dehydrogenase maturation factor n=1 Tax=Desulfacinum hydrothermale DSM 13146 TaxID=1121390 RepID=A0A1W1XFX7_9BACT|nr:carbon monoxide dehydrogenase accessory protein CooC [Desulfacinum hydrothermale]SMC22849.1 CO dehydrogenase maturation factor [Desulfacinum hydrothermale DSM 13146]
MKIAVSGKGGVGKTTLSAFLARWFASQGKSVLAIDADPDANLGHALGVRDAGELVPISQMKQLIAERTESVPGSFGGFFKMNPQVDDLPEKVAVPCGNGIRLMVMGGVKKGGTGCVCPESVLLKNLVHHLILRRDEVVVMDMEAGIEHLGRGTSRAVNALIVVVEPGRRSIETALKVEQLAKDIGIDNLYVVGNKIRSDRDAAFLQDQLPGYRFLGFVPYDEAIIEADLAGTVAEDVGEKTRAALTAIAENLKEQQQPS